MARRKTPAPAPANAMPLEHWPLDRFKPYDRNPRRWGDGVVARMARAVKDFGFRVPVLAKSDGSMIDGHLRLAAAVSLKLATVPVLIADDMTPAQIKAFRISVNQAATWADWDFDLLAAEIGELKELDFDLGSLGFLDGEIDSIIGGFGIDGVPDEPGADVYSRKIECPIYTPKGERPAPSDLFDTKKAAQLRAEIAAADLPPDVAAFLNAAADRHIVFDFHQIAEFYCNANAATQRLMENSALVIIDFKKAIAGGFVKLTDEIQAMAFGEDSEDGQD